MFQFEIISISLAANDERVAAFDEKPRRETVHFWLCGSCAATMTLVLEAVRGLKLVPLQERDPSVHDFSPVRRDNLNVT